MRKPGKKAKKIMPDIRQNAEEFLEKTYKQQEILLNFKQNLRLNQKISVNGACGRVEMITQSVFYVLIGDVRECIPFCDVLTGHVKVSI